MTTASPKERLFAFPERLASYLSGGYGQVKYQTPKQQTAALKSNNSASALDAFAGVTPTTNTTLPATSPSSSSSSSSSGNNSSPPSSSSTSSSPSFLSDAWIEQAALTLALVLAGLTLTGIGTKHLLDQQQAPA